MNLPNSLYPLGVVRWLHEPQSTMVHPEVGFPHCVGRYRPVGSPSWFSFCWNCRDMEGFLIRRWDLPNSLRPVGVVRWLHEPQSTMVHPKVGCPHCVGRYRSRGSSSWFSICWNCRDMEGFLIRGWDLNLPVSGATSTLAGGATLAAR